jgi:hypothetical protein
MFLRTNPICAGAGTLNATGLTWEYQVRPTLLSREYLLRIVFERKGIPSVFVKRPDLTVLAESAKSRTFITIRFHYVSICPRPTNG